MKLSDLQRHISDSSPSGHNRLLVDALVSAVPPVQVIDSALGAEFSRAVTAKMRADAERMFAEAQARQATIETCEEVKQLRKESAAANKRADAANKRNYVIAAIFTIVGALLPIVFQMIVNLLHH